MKPNLQGLRDSRAHLLDQVDDIIRTAQADNRGLTDQERADHDGLVSAADALEAEINRSSGSFNVPNVNRIGTAPVSADRSLDELFWATNDVVRAGTITKNGEFNPDPTGATNRVDRPVLGYDASNVPIEAPRMAEFQPEAREVVRSFQQLVSDMQIFGGLISKNTVTGTEAFQVARSHPIYADRYQSMLRAMDVDTSGQGIEWVPTGIGAAVHEKVRAAGKVSPLFQRINLPTNPWKWPIEGGDATAYRVAEPTSDTETPMTASTPGTVAPTFDAEILGARVIVSRSMDADSAVAIVPFIEGKLAKAHMIAEERAILDGDSDGTHQDSDVQAIGSSDARTAWDGLRKKGLAQTASSQTSTTSAKIALVRADMGKWGIDPADMAIIMGVRSYFALLGDTNLLTVDKFGPNATLLAGQLGAVHGIPVIVSEYVREDLNASGVYDGITTTKTYFLVVNRAQWAIGQRMNLEIETDDSVRREVFQRTVVSFQRLDMQNLAEAATDDDTGIGYATVSGT